MVAMSEAALRDCNCLYVQIAPFISALETRRCVCIFGCKKKMNACVVTCRAYDVAQAWLRSSQPHHR